MKHRSISAQLPAHRRSWQSQVPSDGSGPKPAPRLGAAFARLNHLGTPVTAWLRRALAVVTKRLHPVGGITASWLRTARLRRAARLAVPLLALPPLLALGGAVYHIYFDRSGLPDLGAFLRFEPPTIGEVFDDQGKVLIELAREYRRVVTYEDVPLILRQAILAAEDKNFFSHSGVEYRVLP